MVTVPILCVDEQRRPVAHAGVSLTILRWSDCISVELLDLGQDAEEIACEAADCPPAELPAAIAAAIARVTEFAAACGEGGDA